MTAPAAEAPLELRLERDRAQVRLAGVAIAPAVTVVEAVLDVPATGGLDVAAGPAPFRSRRCDLDRLELWISSSLLAGARDAGLRAAARAGFVELAGELADAGPFTARLTPLAGEGGVLELALHAARRSRARAAAGARARAAPTGRRAAPRAARARARLPRRRAG